MNYEVSLSFEQYAHYEHMKKVLNDFQNTNRYYQLVSYTKNFVSLRNIFTNDHVAYKTNEVGFIFTDGDKHSIPFDAVGLKTGAYLYQYHTGGNPPANSKKYIFTRPENIDQIMHYNRKDMLNAKYTIDVIDFNNIVSEKDQTIDFIINEDGEFKWSLYPESDTFTDNWRKKHWGVHDNPLTEGWYGDMDFLINFDIPADYDQNHFYQLLQTLSTKTKLSFIVDIIDGQSEAVVKSWLMDP